MRHSDFQSRFEDWTEVKISSDINPPLHMFDFWCQKAKIVTEKEILQNRKNIGNNDFKDLQHVIEYVSLNL